MNKYNARKQEIDGILFDSMKEAKRYTELKVMQDQGEIHDLKIHVVYELIPTQRIDGKCVELPCKYICDFDYMQGDEHIVEDVKGYRRGDAYRYYVIKRKLMLERYGIRIKEI